MPTTRTASDQHSWSFSSLGSSEVYQQTPSPSDIECGEPFVPQHLVLDFAHEEGIDNEIVEKKCCDFWDFVAQHPALEKIKAKPIVATVRDDTVTMKTSTGYRDSAESLISDTDDFLEILKQMRSAGVLESAMPVPECAPCTSGCAESTDDLDSDAFSVLLGRRPGLGRGGGRRDACWGVENV